MQSLGLRCSACCAPSGWRQGFAFLASRSSIDGALPPLTRLPSTSNRPYPPNLCCTALFMFICSTVRNSELKFFSVIRRSADAERKQIVSYLQSNLSYRPLKVEVGNGETVPLCTSALD